ncbi:NTP transferase domain-containing protein [Halonotius terrestris]|nr:NTP transferase domain-containing protein [Halonotius terrestris]
MDSDVSDPPATAGTDTRATNGNDSRATTGLVMCGGEGSRLRPAVGDTEKPLVEVGDEPMIDRVVAALQASSLTTVAAAVSPATPETAAHLVGLEGIECIETAGEGYVADLREALARLDTPTVTVAADLPLVTANHVDRAVAIAAGDSLTVCVPASLAADLGVSAETTIDHDGESVVPTGLNVVGDGVERTVVWQDNRLAYNVNRPGDLRAVEAWLDHQ